MTTSVNISTAIQNDMWHIQANVISGSDIPQDVFMYENSGTGLGEYIGVCTLKDYKRIQTYTGTPIAVFGNKYLKTTTLHKYVDLSKSTKPFVDKIQADITIFRTEYLAGSSTNQVITIS
jgi:hypothetical protein